MASEAEYRKQARHCLRALGIDPDEVAKLWPRLAAGAPGRRKHPPVPHQFLARLELFARVAVRDRDGKYQYWYGKGKPKLTRKKAIRWMAEVLYVGDPQWSEKQWPEGSFLKASRDATAFASYLEKELRRNGFHKKPDKELLSLSLLPPFLDVKQLCLDIVHIPPFDD